MDDTTSAVPAPSASDHIGPYRIERVIGTGAEVIRCLATDTRRQREVVLEVLPLTLSRRPEVIERLGHLADAVRQIRHRGLVRLHRFAVDPDRPELAYFVWQHVPGRTLAELIDASGGGLPIERVGAWTAQLAEAIDHLEEHGPGHGGVRPENIIIDDHGEARLSGAVVWREVRRLSGIEDQTEIRRDRLGASRDVRDLAATTYAALCGGDIGEVRATRPQPIAGLSAQLNMALIAALEDDTTEQFTCAADLVRSLEGAPLREMLIPRRAPLHRSPAPLLTGVAVLAIMLSAITWSWTLLPPLRTTTLLDGARHAVAPLVASRSSAPQTTTAGTDSLATPLARPEAAPPSVVGAQPAAAPKPVVPEALPSVVGAQPVVAPPPVVPEAALVEAARRAEEAKRLTTRLERSRRPGIQASLQLAAMQMVQAAGMRRVGHRAEALAAYEQAADAFEQAVVDDALAATIVRLGHRLRDELDHVRQQADGRLDAAIRGVTEIVQAGEQAYRDADYAHANLAWREAEQMLASVRSLGDLLEAASLASARWRSVTLHTPPQWYEPLRDRAEVAFDLARRADERFDEQAYEQAIAAWEEASREVERLLVAQHRVQCEVEELAEAWLVTQAAASLEDVELAEIASLRRAALEKADEARRARECGELDMARVGYAEAAAVWNEAVETHCLLATHSGDPTTNSVGQQLVFVEGGVFLMGSPIGEVGRDPSETQREVHLPAAVLMATTEVSRAQFAMFVEESGYRTDAERRGWSHGLRADGRWRRVNGLSWRAPGFEQTDDHPVVCVSYTDATAFCDWLSQREGRRYRLPTEAEWEYACRAGAITAYHWGDEPSAGAGFENAADASWVNRFEETQGFPWSDGCLHTCPVGHLRANRWGLHDMHGNVQEWCMDAYATEAVMSIESTTGSLAADAASPRVIRGGSFAAPPGRCRAAHRDASTPETSFATLGFRVVAEPVRRAAR